MQLKSIFAGIYVCLLSVSFTYTENLKPLECAGTLNNIKSPERILFWGSDPKVYGRTFAYVHNTSPISSIIKIYDAGDDEIPDPLSTLPGKKDDLGYYLEPYRVDNGAEDRFPDFKENILVFQRYRILARNQWNSIAKVRYENYIVGLDIIKEGDSKQEINRKLIQWKRPTLLEQWDSTMTFNGYSETHFLTPPKLDLIKDRNNKLQYILVSWALTRLKMGYQGTTGPLTNNQIQQRVPVGYNTEIRWCMVAPDQKSIENLHETLKNTGHRVCGGYSIPSKVGIFNTLKIASYQAHHVHGGAFVNNLFKPFFLVNEKTSSVSIDTHINFYWESPYAKKARPVTLTKQRIYSDVKQNYFLWADIDPKVPASMQILMTGINDNNTIFTKPISKSGVFVFDSFAEVAEGELEISINNKIVPVKLISWYRNNFLNAQKPFELILSYLNEKNFMSSDEQALPIKINPVSNKGMYKNKIVFDSRNDKTGRIYYVECRVPPQYIP